MRAADIGKAMSALLSLFPSPNTYWRWCPRARRGRRGGRTVARHERLKAL